MWIREAPFFVGASAGIRTPTVATLQGLPGGTGATIDTLKAMRQFARASVRAPDQRVRELALSLVRDLPPRSWLEQVKALHAFVRDRIRYVRDPDGAELVATPEKTLEYGQGDCDDKCTLLAALLTSIGHPARFVALGFNGAPFSHVIVETKHGEKWIACETIIPKPLGWTPPAPTSSYILKV